MTHIWFWYTMHANHSRPLNGASTSCVQVAPSVEDQTSKWQVEPSLPPISHILPLKETTDMPSRGFQPAEEVAWVQLTPSDDDQTSFLFTRLLSQPPTTQ